MQTPPSSQQAALLNYKYRQIDRKDKESCPHRVPSPKKFKGGIRRRRLFRRFDHIASD
jgi:hypothetical protein